MSVARELRDERYELGQVGGVGKVIGALQRHEAGIGQAHGELLPAPERYDTVTPLVHDERGLRDLRE